MTVTLDGARTCPASAAEPADRWSANGLPPADDTLPRRAVSILRLPLIPLVRIERVLIIDEVTRDQCHRGRLNSGLISGLRAVGARAGAARGQK